MAPDKGLDMYFESGASANSTTPATIDSKVFSAPSAILHLQGAAKLEQKKSEGVSHIPMIPSD
ncbi:MAG: hypothetical protein FJ240_06345 [Nitrospira sp.]|nr:hypothetical protein [Nitrospira sp.]